MERLTEKTEVENYKGNTMLSYIPKDHDYVLASNKLGELEDIEEELSCPLDVLFRALREGIYAPLYLGSDKMTDYNVVTDGETLHASPVDLYNEYWDLSDYKKTWWLKPDKSE